MKLRVLRIAALFGVVLFFFVIVSVGLVLPGRGRTKSALQVGAQAAATSPSVAEALIMEGSAQSKAKTQERQDEDEEILPGISHEPTPKSYQDVLYIESQKYIATTAEEADKVARRIGFLDGKNESASLACGPISIAILKDAKLLPPDVSVRKIWLLCPREREDCSGINTLQREYFPPAEYDYWRIEESVRTYDFRSNPLQAGDWMYLFASYNGFDHMLAVTRVDKDGVAYTVTNINRGNGFVIVESPLYNPNQSGKGLFYELTDPSRGNLGMSGNGGFLLVRRKTDLTSLQKDCSINNFLSIDANR